MFSDRCYLCPRSKHFRGNDTPIYVNVLEKLLQNALKIIKTRQFLKICKTVIPREGAGMTKGEIKGL